MKNHSGSGSDKWQKLAEVIRKENLPKVCNRHPRPCWYDGPDCPACQAESEFKDLTRGMLYSNRRKPS